MTNREHFESAMLELVIMPRPHLAAHIATIFERHEIGDCGYKQMWLDSAWIGWQAACSTPTLQQVMQPLAVTNSEKWVPCSPEWIRQNPDGCSRAPRVWCEEETNHYHPKTWPTPALPQVEEETAWLPIETAPTDNKRSLYLARFVKGRLVEIDFDGAWERWEESLEMSHINGWTWVSANGIVSPTHWAYQDKEIPQVPEGMAIVPVELTDEMLVAARDWSYKKYGQPIGNDAAKGCWQAMLTAAKENSNDNN